MAFAMFESSVAHTFEFMGVLCPMWLDTVGLSDLRDCGAQVPISIESAVTTDRSSHRQQQSSLGTWSVEAMHFFVALQEFLPMRALAWLISTIAVAQCVGSCSRSSSLPVFKLSHISATVHVVIRTSPSKSPSTIHPVSGVR